MLKKMKEYNFLIPYIISALNAITLAAINSYFHFLEHFLITYPKGSSMAVILLVSALILLCISFFISIKTKEEIEKNLKETEKTLKNLTLPPHEKYEKRGDFYFNKQNDPMCTVCDVPFSKAMVRSVFHHDLQPGYLCPKCKSERYWVLPQKNP